MVAAAIRLKQLRLAADPPISIRKMAERLGLDHSTYVRYERPERFKKKHLPIELTRKIAAVLGDHGVPASEVMELAGWVEDEPGGVELSAGEEQLLKRFRHLDASQRRLLLQLAEHLDRGDAAVAPKGDTAVTVQASRQSYAGEAAR